MCWICVYLLVCHHHSSAPLLTLKFSFQPPVYPASLLFPEHWGWPRCSAARGGWRRIERRRRRRRKGGGERAHIHSTDGFPLLPHTHSLSQTHPLLRGRQEREGARGGGEEGGWGEKGAGTCCIQGPLERREYMQLESNIHLQPSDCKAFSHSVFIRGWNVTRYWGYMSTDPSPWRRFDDVYVMKLKALERANMWTF